MFRLALLLALVRLSATAAETFTCDDKVNKDASGVIMIDDEVDNNGNTADFYALIGALEGGELDVNDPSESTPPDIGASCMEVTMELEPMYLSGTTQVGSTGVWCSPCNAEITSTITSQFYLDDDSNMQMTMTIDMGLHMDNTFRFDNPEVTDAAAQTMVVDQGDTFTMAVDSMEFDITPSLSMTIDANSLVKGSGEYYETSESFLGITSVTKLDTRPDAAEPVDYDATDSGGTIGDAKTFSTNFKVSSGGDKVGVTITAAMKLEPRMFYEYSEATVDLMTGRMTQTTPMAVTFNGLGADDCSKSTDMSVIMAMESMTVGKVESDYETPIGGYTMKYDGVDLIEEMNNNDVETTQEQELDTTGAGSCAVTSTADFVEGSFEMTVSEPPSKEDTDQLRTTMQAYLETALGISTILFTDFTITYTEVTTSRRSLLATSYVWEVSYTMIVVDSTFDSAADLYEGINEAITSDAFENTVEADLGVEVEIDDDSLSTQGADSSGGNNKDNGVSVASLAMVIVGSCLVLLAVCGFVFCLMRTRSSKNDAENKVVDATSVNPPSIVSEVAPGTTMDSKKQLAPRSSAKRFESL